MHESQETLHSSAEVHDAPALDANMPDHAPAQSAADTGSIAARDPQPAPGKEKVKTRTSCLQPTEAADPRLPPSLAFVTLVVVVAIVLALNSLNDGQLGHGQSLVDRAEEAIAQKDWPAALGAIQKVDEKNRQRPGYLRVLADYLIGTHSSPELLGNTLEKLKPSVMFRPDDHLWLCSAWLASNHLDRARTAWEGIPAALVSGLEATQLKIELLKREGQKREAEQIQDSLSKIFADDPAVAVQQAAKEWSSSFPEVRQHARERLRVLARRHDAPGLSAIRHLSGQTEHTRAELDLLLQLATDHPDARAADRLGIVSLLLPLESDTREALIRAEVVRYQTGGPAVLAQLSTWLAREKEPDRILELIPRTRWKEQPVLLPLVVQALVDQARWQDLLDTLQEAENSRKFDMPQILNWRAQALMKLHPDDNGKPRDVLDSAIRQAKVYQNYVALMTSVHIAEDWQMADLALDACWFLAQAGRPNEAELLEKCMQLAAIERDTDALTEAVVRLSALQPNNIRAARRTAYLRLLRGEMLETSSPPPSDTFSSSHCTYSSLLTALRAARLGDIPAMRAALSQLSGSLDLSSGERAVLAGLLAKLGETARAFQIAEKIHPELLLEEEKVFLNMAR